MNKNKLCRTAVALLLPLGILGAYLVVTRPELHVSCLFFELTGLYCPGCGSGRAAAALITGDIPRAFSYNPLVFILGFPAGTVLIHEYLRFVFPNLGLKPVYIPTWAARGAAAIVIVFWFLRNITAFSFLAP